MKFFDSFLFAGVAFVGVTGAAVAADPIMPTPVAPVVSADDWSGFYAGVNAGYGWGEGYDDGGILLNGGLPYDQVNGVLGGAQLGGNAQVDGIVFGLETDFQVTGLAQEQGTITVALDYFGTLRARLGADVGNGILPYLTAGLAYGQGSVSSTNPMLGSDSQFHIGWAAGGGVEFKLDDQLSIKGEYLYTDFGQLGYTLGGITEQVGIRAHTARVGINFHF